MVIATDRSRADERRHDRSFRRSPTADTLGDPLASEARPQPRRRAPTRSILPARSDGRHAGRPLGERSETAAAPTRADTIDPSGAVRRTTRWATPWRAKRDRSRADEGRHDRSFRRDPFALSAGELLAQRG